MPTSSDGVCRIDGVLLGELKLNLLVEQRAVLEAVYALVNTKTGSRYGRGTRNANWSAETLAKVSELVQAIERDILSDVFEGGTTSPGGEADSAYTSDGIQGL